MRELLSIGIDVGTTTTQIIFSKLTIENRAGVTAIPEFKITQKFILYKSKIYYTPLIDNDLIDFSALKAIVTEEYHNSGFQTADTGAVIITGETARKENASLVLESLAGLAGDFVVSTAGPDLEGILAGRGAGAGEFSKKSSGNVINFDIGGGTTNAAVFFNGEVIDSFALDIGGRLIKFDELGRITYISNRIYPLIQHLELTLKKGANVVFEDLQKLCGRLAEMFLELLSLKTLTEDTAALFISHGHRAFPVEIVSFSGGVAEYIYNQQKITSLSDLKFNDLGPLLGQCIRETISGYQLKLIEPGEKIRATVIGAGNHSLHISGSTIAISGGVLPLKNIPVLRVFADHELEDPGCFYDKITAQFGLYPNQPVAIAFRGSKSPGYTEIKKIADQIVASCEHHSEPIIVIIEHDFAKALGQTILNGLPVNRPLICLDRISVKGGDYIDIGSPVMGVVPVVIKTLAFNT